MVPRVRSELWHIPGSAGMCGEPIWIRWIFAFPKSLGIPGRCREPAPIPNPISSWGFVSLGSLSSFLIRSAEERLSLWQSCGLEIPPGGISVTCKGMDTGQGCGCGRGAGTSPSSTLLTDKPKIYQLITQGKKNSVPLHGSHKEQVTQMC